MKLGNSDKEHIRNELIGVIRAGDAERIEIYSRALKGEVMVCRNFEDLLKATSGYALSNRYDYEDGVQGMLAQHIQDETIKEPEFIWIPDEKGKGFEQFLDTLKIMYVEAGDWNEVDQQRIAMQLKRNT